MDYITTSHLTSFFLKLIKSSLLVDVGNLLNNLIPKMLWYFNDLVFLYYGISSLKTYFIIHKYIVSRTYNTVVQIIFNQNQNLKYIQIN